MKKIYVPKRKPPFRNAGPHVAVRTYLTVPWYVQWSHDHLKERQPPIACSSYHSRYGQEQSKRHYQLREYSLITLIWRLYAARLGKNDNEVCKNARFDKITTDGSYHHIIGNCLHRWRDNNEASLSFTSISYICSVMW